MKSRDENHVRFTVFAALLIIGCSLASMLSCHRRRCGQKQQLDEAVQMWEAEGGAVVAERDEDDETSLTLIR
jgi:hypothetical protein